MMFIIFSLIVILFVLSIFFRKQITGLTGTVKDYAIGNWYRAYPVFRKALIVGGIGWGVLIVLMTGIGAYANSIEAALIISILFPFWFLSMLIPRRTVPSPTKWKIPIFGIIRVFGGIILLFASLSLAFGIWSPGGKDALNERYKDAKVAFENSFRKGHLQSERNAGTKGWITNDTNLYDETYTAVQPLKKDEEIYITNLKGGKSANDQREAVLPAMLKNKDGDFFKGREGWIPTMNIGWEKPNNTEVLRASAKDSTAKDPDINTIFDRKWKYSWKKPAGYVDANSSSDGYNFVKINLSDDGSQLEIKEVDGQFTFTGEQLDEKSLQGSWKNNVSREGDFFLKFSADFQSAEGWYRDKGRKVKVPIWLTKT